MKTEYLIVLGAMLVVPLVASFSRRLRFYQNGRALALSIGIMTGLFGLWDIIAAGRGHWRFDQDYIIGLSLLGLPIEEWLFFVVLGFVSVFTFEAVSHLLRKER